MKPNPYTRTPEPAEHRVTHELPQELEELDQTLTQCYNHDTPEQIGQVFGYRRAESILNEVDNTSDK